MCAGDCPCPLNPKSNVFVFIQIGLHMERDFGRYKWPGSTFAGRHRNKHHSHNKMSINMQKCSNNLVKSLMVYMQTHTRTSKNVRHIHKFIKHFHFFIDDFKTHENGNYYTFAYKNVWPFICSNKRNIYLTKQHLASEHKRQPEHKMRQTNYNKNKIKRRKIIKSKQ